MTEQSSGGKAKIGKLVPIEWPEAGIAAYANNLLAVSDGTSSYLTFCQITPPAFLGTEEEKRKQLDQVKRLKAQPVTRLVVPLHALRDMVRILQEQIKRTDNTHPDDAATSDT